VRISAVLPVYNREATIGRAVQSVLAQTLAPAELIVVDDGSNDRTCDILSGVHDARLRLVRLGTNRGASHARNVGVAAARGNVVAFIDSDDLWHVDKLERQTAAMRANPDRRASCTGFIVHRLGSGARSSRVPNMTGSWFDTLLDQCAVSPGTTLMLDREVFDEVGLFDTRLRRFEDWDWLLRYAERNEILMVPDILAEVFIAGYADPELIDESAKTLLSLHRERIARLRGRGGVRRFRASLEIERAVSRIAHKQTMLALRAAFHAALIDPARAARFARRGLAKMRERDF
jgi:glycosyltransferase involved in cell wall biosynthesis